MKTGLLPWQRAPFEQWLARSGHFPQALLIHGPSGTGKIPFAQHLARALLCESEQEKPCGECPACRWFEAEHHPDIRILDPEKSADEDKQTKGNGQILVDDIRSLHEFLTLSSHRLGKRLVLLLHAEALNLAAANALLKSLEEPAPGTHFILVTHVPGRLPATVRSRCQSLLLPGPSREVALQWLATQSVDHPEIFLALSGGAPLDALRLSQTDAGPRVSWLKALSDPHVSLTRLSALTSKIPAKEWVDWLHKWVHDMLEQKATGNTRYHSDLSEWSARMARQADLHDLLMLENRLKEARRWLHHPLNERLLAESLLMPLMTMR